MSFETNLERIASSLELIAAALSAKPVTVATAPAQPVPVATPVVAPVTVEAVAPVVAAPVMPAAPVFTSAVAAPVVLPSTPIVEVAKPASAVQHPFADKNAMMDFVLSSYKALGPEKGAKIQDVLVAMGFANINDVPEAQWGQLKSGIEALKG